MDFRPLIDKIDGHLQRDAYVLVFLDGMAGAGKTTLAASLKERYSCNVISMDDFFLRPEQRTPERLAEPGGNIDYERFISEAAIPLLERKVFNYRPYDCGMQELAEPIFITPGRLTVIEGVYSMHPKIFSAFRSRGAIQNPKIINVFMKISETEQQSRLQSRAPEKFDNFVKTWIPMENKYFEHFKILDGCDLVLSDDFMGISRH